MVLSETYYKSVFGFEEFSEKLPHSGVEQVSYLACKEAPGYFEN